MNGEEIARSCIALAMFTIVLISMKTQESSPALAHAKDP